ncbi:MAG TPA: ABC transporter ATP-binding protein [Clostridiales bacterium]|nr:ABC transporter ATP-binding protein [Clostridiales bacterium]
MSEKAFVLTGVEKQLGDFRLKIDDLSMDRGFVLGLVGRNGAGKTTTIRILLNLIYPDRGRVSVLGLSMPRDESTIKRRIGYVSENPSFYEDMTVAWTIGLVSRYYPAWDQELSQHYLRKFDLDPRKRVKQLSKGMRVKLALTLALSHRPELLLLDEPTSGVDPVIRRELLEEIADMIKDERHAVVFSSHITQDVEQVADYVAIIDDGRVREYADKERLLDRWCRVTGRTPANGRDISPLFRSLRTQGDSFSGITDRYSPEWERRLEETGVSGHRVHRLGLDEILLSLSGKEI